MPTGDKKWSTIYQHSCFLLCLVVCAYKHVLSALVPCLRTSHWLAFLPGQVEQTVLKGSPSVHPPAAPPAGWLRCWPEHWSLPESSALEKKERTHVIHQHQHNFNLSNTPELTDVTDQGICITILVFHCRPLSEIIKVPPATFALKS